MCSTATARRARAHGCHEARRAAATRPTRPRSQSAPPPAEASAAWRARWRLGLAEPRAAHQERRCQLANAVVQATPLSAAAQEARRVNRDRRASSCRRMSKGRPAAPAAARDPIRNQGRPQHRNCGVVCRAQPPSLTTHACHRRSRRRRARGAAGAARRAAHGLRWAPPALNTRRAAARRAQLQRHDGRVIRHLRRRCLHQRRVQC